MQLFFNPNLHPASNSISFDKLESKHIIRVLRKRENDITLDWTGLTEADNHKAGWLASWLGNSIKSRTRIVADFDSVGPLAERIHR